MMKNFIFTLLTISIFAFSKAQCLEITSIFVDACNATTDEGMNEMFTFTVGATPLNTNDISVDWGTSNTFTGWCSNPTSTAALNATITTSCGFLIEPLANVLPANANVLVVTSENFSLTDNDFSNLSDTMYILYQCGGVAGGHFSNSNNNTLVVFSTNACTGNDAVSYIANSLVGGDGATVLYTPAGNATYVNNGCTAPVITATDNTDWTFANGGTYDGRICNNHGVIDLTALLSSNATPGGTWSGPRVTGTNYNPAAYLGLDSVTYTLPPNGTCSLSSDSTIVFNVVEPQTINTNVITCDSLLVGGVWYSSSQIINVVTPSSTFYSCDSTTNIDLTIAPAYVDSSYIEACDSVIYQGVTYYSDTIIRDTISGGGNSTGACSELFISEYIEGASNDKAIEIYNGTGVTVDLSNYTLERYSNGSATSSASIPLIGMLADGDVFVAYNNSGNVNASIVAAGDLASGLINHNGDDAYSLNKNGVIVDIFGNIGCDPGNEWNDLGDGTANNVLYRQTNYTSGLLSTINPPCNFPTLNATNWVSLDADDNFTFLGSHTANCSTPSTSSCDSVFVINISVQQKSFGSVIQIQECSNSFTIPNTGQIVTTNGVYNDTLTSVNSCDSIQPYDVFFLPNLTKTVNATICQGDSFQLEGSNQFVFTENSYTSTIVAANGCDTIVTTNLVVENPIITTSTDTIVCSGDIINLSANGTPIISWSTTENTNNITVNPTSTTTYTVQGSTVFGCQTALEQIEVTVEQAIDNVSFDINPGTTINEGETVQILVNGNNITNFSWTPINENTNTVIDNPSTTTTYLVTLSNNPCPILVDSITIVVNVLENIVVVTPDAISPNGDGLNDVFRIVNFEDFESYNLKIYNRWGDLMHEETAFGASWDGKFKGQLQNLDTYIYYIDAKPMNGKPNVQTSGSVTVLR